jgi:hypothetical protein
MTRIKMVYQLLPERVTVFHILQKENRVKGCRAIRMEEEHIDVTPEQINGFFASLIATVEGVSAHFVMNMDEMDQLDCMIVRNNIVPSRIPFKKTTFIHRFLAEENGHSDRLHFCGWFLCEISHFHSAENS